jgi:hypothetical protein
MTAPLDDALQDEIRALLWQLIESNLPSEGADRLFGLLKQNEPARIFYLLELNLYNNLYWDNATELRSILNRGVLERCGADSTIGSSRLPAPPLPQRSGSPLLTGLITAARGAANSSVVVVSLLALVLYGTFAFLVWNLQGTPRPSHHESAVASSVETRLSGDDATSSRHVATLLDMAGTWKSSATQHEPKKSLVAGEQLHLQTGTARIRFEDGAEVTLHGPIEFSLEAAGRGKLAHGKLFAHVPRMARGFTIDTPSTTIVDLGTEFGVEVDDHGEAEVHVLVGEVQLAPAPGAQNLSAKPWLPLRIGAGHAVRVSNADVRPVAAHFSPKRFKQPKLSISRYATAVMADTPMAYFRLDEERGFTAHDLSANAVSGQYRVGGKNLEELPQGRGPVLRVAGPQPPELLGFELNNAGVQFEGAGVDLGPASNADNLWISGLPLEGPTYSFEAWIYNARANAAELITAYIGGRGGSKNQYDAFGIMGTFVPAETGRLFLFNGKDMLTGKSMIIENTWQYVVYTRTGDEVAIYLNGEVEVAGTLAATFGEQNTICFGARADTYWGLKGRGDEVAIYNVALSAEQIRAHYLAALGDYR